MQDNTLDNILIDEETAEDLINGFDEHYDVIQVSLNKLMHNTSDKDLINTTFRSMHTIKGNASMVQIQAIVDYAHAIEETIGAMRADYFAADQTLCELLLSAIDRLRDLHNKYLFKREIPFVDEVGIISAFNSIANAKNPDAIAQQCARLTTIFSPEPLVNIVPPAEVAELSPSPQYYISINTLSQHGDYLTLSESQADDLLFFRLLSLQVDAQNDFWDKRTDLLLFLALKTVSLSDKPIDNIQLTAAVYMHDTGMAFVTDDIVNKTSKLNTLETKKLQQHPIWSYNLLKRMTGWGAASDMVLTHHERIDGGGYPNKLLKDDIHEGAKLLAILDAYFAMTNMRADRSHRRSILRAISEINACSGTQFCSYWVGLFNKVVKEEVKLGTI